jgi:transposase
MLGERVIAEKPPTVEKRTHAPKRYPCSSCGKLGRRIFTRTRRVRHLAHQREVWWEVTVGIYQAKCGCARQHFTSTVPGVEVGAEYTNAVREKLVDLIVRDHLSNYKAIEHLAEDFLIKPSIGFIYDALEWAGKKGIPRRVS